MPITRFAVIKGFDQVIMGRDLAGIFKNGHVYQVNEICGEFLIKDLGEHALMPSHAGSSISNITMNGKHCFTKEEYDLILQKEKAAQ